MELEKNSQNKKSEEDSLNNSNNNSDDKSKNIDFSNGEISSSETMQKFISKTVKLLELEHEAEIQEAHDLHETLSDKELELRGICLQKLKIEEQRTGLGGRVLLKLFHYKPGIEVPLPAHKFSSGDIVALVPYKEKMTEKNRKQGVISRVTNNRITVAFDEFIELDDLSESALFSLHLLTNDITYKRHKNAMKDLENFKGGPASRLIDVLFGSIQPSFSPPILTFVPFNPNLNPSQIEAIKFALTDNDIALCHGPAGTGKTTTVVEMIQQFVKMGYKVLACGPSNISVDNMVERLSSSKIKMVRIGHPARLLQSVLDYSMDVRIHSDENSAILKDIRQDLDRTLLQLQKTRNKEQKFSLRGELKLLRKELVEREQKIIDDIIRECDVIFCTNSGAADRMIQNIVFDVVIIDEAAQAQEASCWIPLLKGKRLILAGDHCQLPPTIKSVEAEKKGLGITLFERMMKQYGESISRMLDIQYRMNELIMKFPSIEFYQNKLKAHSSVIHHLLINLPNIKNTSETKTPLILIDTAGCNCEEAPAPEGDSKSNVYEAEICIKHIKRLLSSGLDPKDMAIITPYNAQVNLLKRSLGKQYPTLEIGSVDGFQGREKEAIIISLVRSNPQHEVGFLSENRRTNVALTRARRNLVVIGDSETVSSNPFLKRLLDFMQQHAEVRSAHEYLSESLEGISIAPLSLESRQSEKEESKKYSQTQKTPKENKKEKKNPNLQTKQKAPTNHVESKEREQKSKGETESKTILQKRIEEFMENELQNSLDFEPTLKSFERMIVHELAEQFHLNHVSIGEGKERFIRISKNIEKEEEIEEEEKNIEKEEEIEEEEKKDKSKPKPKPKTSKKVDSSKKKIFENKASSVSITSKVVDLILNEAIEQNKVCAFTGCKQSILTLSRFCSFCNKKYCFMHGVAEQHGCGDAAKKKAREEWLAQGKNIVTGNPVTNKPLKPEQRKNLQKQLQKKIENASSSRKSKTKENNDNTKK